MRATAAAKQWNAPSSALLGIHDGDTKATATSKGKDVAEERAGESMDVYRSLVAEVPEGIMICDAQLHCVQVNQAACALLDSPESGLLGQTIEEIFLHGGLAHPHPNSGGDSGKCVSEVFRGNLWLEVATFWLPNQSLAVNIRDISELKKLQTQLMETHKVQEMGRLAGRIVHDFNNIIMIVSGQTEILLENAGDLPGMRKPLEQILKAARRGAALTSRLLEYGPL